MKILKTMSAVVLAAGMAACGSSSSSNPPPVVGFPQPAGTVAVNFTVDDTANAQWKSQELEWKGEVNFDATTRIATRDPTWLAGTWAKLYDDGPWNAINATTGQPGHEPAGSVAGDHKLGITVFVAPPATGTLSFAYGLRDATNADRANGGWMWSGGNGSFSVAAGATAPVTAPGLTFAAKGSIDLQLTLNTASLLTGFTYTPGVTTIAVKGSAWGWSNIALLDDGTKGDVTAGDGIFTLVLSQRINGAVPPYPGLLKTGDKAEFVWVIDGVEYKETTGDAAQAGVAGATKTGAAAWAPQTVQLTTTGFINTYIQAP
jgi:hypothetical protein